MSAERTYPKNADIHLAATEGSERFYFRTPVGSIASTPAMDAEQARELVADGYRGFDAEDFEQVDGFDARYGDYPDPVDSEREVNAHDLWKLTAATRKGKRVGLQGKRCARKNPTDTAIERLLAEWDDASEVPLHSRAALQQAAGIGPHRASQIVGAAVANNLIETAVRSDE